MAAWSRLRSSFSSSSSSSTTSPSSSSLQPAVLFDLADELWFYSSVVPLPSLSLPSFPSLFTSSPDSSTLIAQCMINSSSFSSSSTPPPDSRPQTHISRFPAFDAINAYPAPDIEEDYVNTFSAYEESAYHWYNKTGFGGSASSSSESDEDEDAYWGYPRTSAGEDEEAYHYYTASSDLDEEDNHHGYHVSSDCEDEQQALVMKEEVLPADPPQLHAHPQLVMKEEVLPADPPQLHAHLQPDDALSGIYDVGVLLKNKHPKRTQEGSHLRVRREAVSRGSTHRPNQVPSNNEQGELKESIKLWAHLVVLPWKAAAQARPLL